MVRNEQVLACLRGERVVLLLKPYKLSFKITYTLLEAAHLRDHTGIGSADVAE
jgi:Mor family transcriptional regulator